MRFSRTNRASIDSMRGLSGKVPSNETQLKLVKEVEKKEKRIKESQEIIAGIAKRKEAVINSYLMGRELEPKLSKEAELKMEYKKKKGETKQSTKRMISKK